MRSPRDFWTRFGCDPEWEDDYLAHHELRPGLLPFLNSARGAFGQIWCLSNDVSNWSAKLRSRFELQARFDGWVISGDVGVRKPMPAIYSSLSERAKATGPAILFVDDRRANLDAAAALGWRTVHFGLESSADATLCAEVWANVLRHR